MSTFPFEIAITPERFVARSGVLGWYKGSLARRLWFKMRVLMRLENTEADDGGHFPATEVPEVFVDHLREALAKIWPSAE